MTEMPADAQQKIAQLQMHEQSLQQILMQKQQFQAQLIETESALSELEKTDTAYKIVGNIMISANKDKLKKELESKKEIVSLRIKTIEKQETQIKEKAKVIQEEVSKSMQ